MKRTTLLLRFGYDGSRFRGVPPQPGQPTIGDAVFQRLCAAFERPPARLVFTARTDTGVHAVENLATCWYTGVEDVPARLAALRADTGDGLMPFDARVVSGRTFARGLAREKTYRYRLEGGWSAGEIADLREADLARKQDPSLDRLPPHLGRCWQVAPDLDPDRMRRAAAFLVGTHDFSAFKVGSLGGKSPVRHVTAIEIHDLRRDGRPHLVIDVTGKGFLRRQVRIMVGTLAECAAGWWEPTHLGEMLASRSRQRAGQAALARGLCLLRLRTEPPLFEDRWTEPPGTGPQPPETGTTPTSPAPQPPDPAA